MTAFWQTLVKRLARWLLFLLLFTLLPPSFQQQVQASTLLETPSSSQQRPLLATGDDSWGTFFPTQGPDFIVNAIIIDGTTLYVAGTFSAVGTLRASNIARYDTITGVWSTLGTEPNQGVNATVNALVMLNGELYVGGSFTTAGGQTVNRIAKWLPTTNTWSTVGTTPTTGTNGTVFELLAFGGELYAGGTFTTVDSISANRVAKWNPTTGVWSALGTSPNDGLSGTVGALGTLSGQLVVGGSFATAGGTAASNIALWNPTTNTWSTLGSGTNGIVNAVLELGGELYAGGSFAAADGVTVNRVAKWNPATNSWAALGTAPNVGVGTTVNALATLGGDLYVGGAFVAAGGQTANRIARWSPATNSWSALSSGLSSQVSTIATLGNELYVGGNFTSAGGINVSRIARWDGSNWSAVGTTLNHGPNDSVSTVAVLSDTLIVGGNFSSVGSITVNDIARWNPANNSWAALGSVPAVGVGGGAVHALAVLSDTVYVGGTFSDAGDVTANGIAKWNPASNSWAALGSLANVGVGSGTVNALAVLNSELYAGGSFMSAGGVVANGVAKWNPASNSWAALGSAPAVGVSGGSVNALAVLNGELYVGGSFVNANGTVANGVAKWNPASNSWAALGSAPAVGVSGGSVNALAVLDGKLYVGGTFVNAGGEVANGIAMWNPASNSWSALGTPPSVGVNDDVFALASHGSDLLIGGRFTSAGGQSANRIVRWHPATNTWSTLGSGIYPSGTGVVAAIASFGGGIMVGGTFTIAGERASLNLAAYLPATPTLSNVSPASGSITGGMPLTITGTNLDGALSVSIGGMPATIIASSATTVAVTAPPHSAGPVALVVTTLAGSASQDNAFTYLDLAATASAEAQQTATAQAQATQTASAVTATAQAQATQTASAVTATAQAQATQTASAATATAQAQATQTASAATATAQAQPSVSTQITPTSTRPAEAPQPRLLYLSIIGR